MGTALQTLASQSAPLPAAALVAFAAALVLLGVIYWVLHNSPARALALVACAALGAAAGAFTLVILATDLFGFPAPLIRMGAGVIGLVTLWLCGFWATVAWKRHLGVRVLQGSRDAKQTDSKWN